MSLFALISCFLYYVLLENNIALTQNIPACLTDYNHEYFLVIEHVKPLFHPLNKDIYLKVIHNGDFNVQKMK